MGVYFVDITFDLFLIETEYLGVFKLVFLALFEGRAVFIQERLLHILEMLIQNDILKSLHHIIKVNIFR